MTVNILFFGRLADVTGKTGISMDNVKDTDALHAELQALYPALGKLNYLTAVERTVITANTPLHDQVTVALLPPFSGG